MNLVIESFMQLCSFQSQEGVAVKPLGVISTERDILYPILAAPVPQLLNLPGSNASTSCAILGNHHLSQEN